MNATMKDGDVARHTETGFVGVVVDWDDFDSRMAIQDKETGAISAGWKFEFEKVS